LFGHSQERIDLLFKASRLFFANWYEVFWDRALVQISALTCSATAKNITVRRLPVLVDAKIKADVRNAVNEAVLAAKFTDDPRNKWIAHRDKNLMLNPIWIGSRRHTAAIGGAR
jgi:hypothetical protein